MSPDSAANTEDEMREEDVDAYAVLMVMDNGKARLKDLIIQKNAQKNSKKLLGDENFDKLDEIRQKE